MVSRNLGPKLFSSQTLPGYYGALDIVVMFLETIAVFGDIFMYNGGVVCYNQETKSFREIEITLTDERTRDAISYSPSFVSLYDLGEEVKWY
ncbi:hypothetical protein ACFX13_022359 [Malus domestica]